jgi:hypothetical protein
MLNRLRPFTLAFVFLLAACGGGGADPADPPAGPKLATEPARAVTATIGSRGGTISATSSAGVVYTLTVPPLALAEPRAITLTPVSAIRGLALDGGLVAAVDLQPGGLVLDAPATLTIRAATAPPAGRLAIALGYQGDAAAFAPTVSRRDAVTWTLLVSHFSGAAVGFGTTQNLAALISALGQGGSAAFVAQLAALDAVTPRDARAELNVFVSWFQSVVLPQIQQAANDGELHRAVSDLQDWLELLSVFRTCEAVAGSPTCAQVIDPLKQAAAAALVQPLRSAISGNNAVCAAQQSLGALMNVLFWQDKAHVYQVDTPANQLDLDSVLAGLCARAVLDSYALDQPMDAGSPHSLDVDLGLRFGQDAVTQQVPFAVDLTAENATLQNPSGFTSTQGFYTTVITPTGNGPVAIRGRACLLEPGTTALTPVCTEVWIDGFALQLTGTWEGSVYDRRTDANGQTLEFTSQMTALLRQNQNAISGEYSVAGGASGRVTATLSRGLLLDFTLSQSQPCTGTYTGRAAVSGDGNDITADFTGTTCVGTHVGRAVLRRAGSAARSSN